MAADRAARRTQEDRKAATRDALLAAGERLFGERGVGAVSGGEVVAAAGVTRGALYYHFDGKEGLFGAVHDRLQTRLAADLQAALASVPAAFDGLLAAVSTFLDHALDPAFQRIVLLDAPVVLGWARWREREVERCLALFEDRLREGLADHGLDDDPADVAQLYFGAVIEGALMIAHAEDPTARRAAVERVLVRTALGLAAGPPGA